MNVYEMEFFARCPNNKLRIHYRLRVETLDVIKVEDLLQEVEGVEGFHEDIADRLSVAFGGLQIMGADHHGVHIETRRGQE